jgi:hypothetical protein
MALRIETCEKPDAEVFVTCNGPVTEGLPRESKGLVGIASYWRTRLVSAPVICCFAGGVGCMLLLSTVGGSLGSMDLEIVRASGTRAVR